MNLGLKEPIKKNDTAGREKRGKKSRCVNRRADQESVPWTCKDPSQGRITKSEWSRWRVERRRATPENTVYQQDPELRIVKNGPRNLTDTTRCRRSGLQTTEGAARSKRERVSHIRICSRLGDAPAQSHVETQGSRARRLHCVRDDPGAADAGSVRDYGLVQGQIPRYTDMYMAGLDTKTSFDMARPQVLAKVLQETGVHGEWIAAMLAEMQKHFKSLQISKHAICDVRCSTDKCSSIRKRTYFCQWTSRG